MPEVKILPEQLKPYVVERVYGEQTLVLYGSHHTNDPEDAQIQDINDRWVKFPKEDAIAIVEGGFDQVAPEQTMDQEQSIRDGGELQLLVHLARADGIKVASPEPSRSEEISYLLKSFDQDAVALYYVLRQLNWIESSSANQGKQDAITRQLKGLQEAGLSCSLNQVKQTHLKLVGEEFDINDVERINRQVLPAPEEVGIEPIITNQIASCLGKLRDTYLLSAIQHSLERGRNVFVVYGQGHIRAVEQGLANL